METTPFQPRRLSVLQLIAITAVANTAVRMIANRPIVPTVVSSAVKDAVAEATASE